MAPHGWRQCSSLGSVVPLGGGPSGSQVVSLNQLPEPAEDLKMITQLDQVLTHLGTGRWSILHFSALCYCSFLIVPHILASPFMGPKIDFSCRLPQDISTDSFHHAGGGTTPLHSSTLNITNPSLVLLNQCTYFINQTSVKCTDWDFDNTTFSTTVTSEYQLVCDKEYLRTTYQSIYMFGVFIGAPLGAVLADKYGRKRMVMLGGYMYVTIAIGSCWLPGLLELLISRILLGIFHPILLNSAFILTVEVAEPRYRTILGFCIYLLWALGTIAWGGTAYLIRDWRLLHLVTSLPGLVLLPALWFMDESPRWLMVQGRHKEAIQVLRKAARWNRAPLPPEDELLHFMAEEVPLAKTTSGTSSCRTVLQHRIKEAIVLFLTPRLRFFTIILYIDYAVVALVYYGLSLSGGSLSDNPFVYMVLTGLMEVPAYTLNAPIVARLGRRPPAVFNFIVSGAALVVLATLPAGWTGLVVSLAMLGKVTITMAYQTIIFFSSELFPTEVRSRGLGTCLMMSRVGSICSSVIVDFLGTSYPWAPSVMFGVASLLVGMATMALPETLGTTTSETVAHLESTAGKSSKSWWRGLMKKICTSQP